MPGKTKETRKPNRSTRGRIPKPPVRRHHNVRVLEDGFRVCLEAREIRKMKDLVSLADWLADVEEHLIEKGHV